MNNKRELLEKLHGKMVARLDNDCYNFAYSPEFGAMFKLVQNMLSTGEGETYVEEDDMIIWFNNYEITVAAYDKEDEEYKTLLRFGVIAEPTKEFEEVTLDGIQGQIERLRDRLTEMKNRQEE